VRPALPEIDCNGIDGTIVSYPTSFEFLGRGIDLMHHGKNDSVSSLAQDGNPSNFVLFNGKLH